MTKKTQPQNQEVSYAALYNLDLGETITIRTSAPEVAAMRVPNGIIYIFASHGTVTATTFAPFTDED